DEDLRVRAADGLRRRAARGRRANGITAGGVRARDRAAPDRLVVVQLYGREVARTSPRRGPGGHRKQHERSDEAVKHGRVLLRRRLSERRMDRYLLTSFMFVSLPAVSSLYFLRISLDC